MGTRSAEPRAASVDEVVRDGLGRLLGVEPACVDFAVRFRDLGLGSRQLLQLLEMLSQHIGQVLPATLAWQHPTPEALVRHVTALGTPVESVSSPTLAQAECAATSEPIAIIGMGCRLPGGVRSPQGYWQLLCEGQSGVREVPSERFDVDVWFDSDVSAPGKLSTRWAGLIDDVESFDAEFFGISPREARQMDPQQRLALELVWETLEDAGIDPSQLRDAPVGVFMGAMWSDYARIMHRDPRAIDAHSATGQDTSIISARVSYALGLSGASLTVNTACSSSAVAIHLAVQSIRSGEVSMALAGGVNLLTSPESTVAMTKFGAMNPAGQCRAFDAGANGYVRGEGGGVVLLKPLRRAIADGDQIYCVIRGSAVNNDGFSNGLTAPNPKAQEAVVRRALAVAGLGPHAVQYVETHGPGTILGDPLEAQALAAVFAAHTTTEQPLLIGSAKTNLGHLEAAAGVAGLIKAALAIQQRMLPPNLHFERPNPHIAFDALHLRVPTRLESWPSTREPPRAGISSFGFGGTNCHIVLEGAPTGTALLLPLAASSRKALRHLLMGAWSLLSQARSWQECAALCKAMAQRCSSGAYRVALVSEYPEDLTRQLASLLSSEFAEPTSDVVRPRLVFVCSGQGAQWLGMARTLLFEPAFRAALDACDAVVRARYGWSVIDELLADAASSRLDSTDVTQLTLASLQIALGSLWRAWGIEPDALVGHSMGEVAACCLAGMLSIEDALCIVGERALLLRDSALPTGGMLAVMVPEGRSSDEICALAPDLEVGGYNSPRTLLLSGSLAALERSQQLLAAQGIECARIKIAYASHSSCTDPVLAELRERLHAIAPGAGTIAVRSTTRDEWLSGAACGPEHWVENLRNPVRFQQAISALASEGYSTFVELSPHPLLLKPIEQTLPNACSTLASCYRGEDGRRTLLEALGALHEAGFEANWDNVFGVHATSVVMRPELLNELDELLGAGRAEPEQPQCVLPFVLSAKSEPALHAQAARLHAYMTARPTLTPLDVAHSLLTTRAAFDVRAVTLAVSRESLLGDLQALSEGTPLGSTLVGRANAHGKLVFVFPGQGSQWVGMAQELLASSEVFAREMRACAVALAPFVDWALLDVLASADDAGSILERVDVVQPVLFAMMVSLAAVWRSQGLQPDAVVGHSQGEIAAAYVAGALTLSDAARIVALRARALTRLSGQGGMVAVELSAAELSPRLTRFEGQLSIAAINSASSTIVSGTEAAIAELLAELASAQILGRRVRVDYASHGPQMEQIEAELLSQLSGIEPRATRIALYSTVTAEILAGERLDAQYWYQNGRATVRFADAVQRLLVDGHRHFVEVSPHPVLTQAVQSVAQVAQQQVAVVGTLRRDQGGMTRFGLGLAELYVRGFGVDFGGFVTRGRKLPLPTYGFQRERHWIDATALGRTQDAVAAGLVAEDHALLDSSLWLANGAGAVFCARWSLASHAWLAEHVVHGVSVVPAAVLLELTLTAAQRVGMSAIEELTLEAPLALPASGEVHIQITVGALLDGVSRALSLHSRRESAGSDALWTRHATATLRATAPQSPAVTVPALRDWPPPGATQISLDGCYETLAQAGLGYGETFRGLRAAYRRGDELFAEVALPAVAGQDAARYALHPALLDAALQVLTLHGDAREVAMPFSWQDVTLEAAGAAALRVCVLVRDPQHVSLLIGDQTGELVARVGSLRLRSASAQQLQRALLSNESLYQVEWTALLNTPQPAAASARASWVLVGGNIEPLPGLPPPAARYADLALLEAALAAGESPPAVVVLACLRESAAQDVVATAHAASHRVLGALQTWLASERLASRRLVVLTRDALGATQHDGVNDVAHAALWGLVRTAQSEHPDGDLRLLDLDASVVPELFNAALASDERQLVVRRGALYAPRLVRVDVPSSVAAPWSSEGTVLITGGSGALAALVAQHLVARHGVRQLLLCSRSGRADALQAQLVAQGASVRVVSCDVSRRSEVAALLASIPARHPLLAVIHTAVILDDGVVTAQTAERIDRVFGAKLDAAWHLHELTRDCDLKAFVMCSSVTGILGGSGVCSYAAANTFLDALAQHRKAAGLAATSLAWGLWALPTGVAGSLDPAGLLRMQRTGICALSPEAGLSLFDAALASSAAQLVPARFDFRPLASGVEPVPCMLSQLAPRRVRRVSPLTAAVTASTTLTTLEARLVSLSAAEREHALLDTVMTAITTVMGLAASRIDAERPLSQVGLDSLLAVELRNHLAALSGLRLPSTLLFDYPTPHALVRYLGNALFASSSVLVPPVPPAPPAAHAAGVASDPIAIVAMSCRYPGGVSSPEELWELLIEGDSVVEGFPTDRGWDVDGLYDRDPDAKGKSYVQFGAFVRDAGAFDAGFFGISARESIGTDPQQRLLLETAWEAIERAGIEPGSLSGSNTSVFVGISQNDYQLLGGLPEGFALTGNVNSVASGRIAYTLGLQGPAVTVDTACSSSLVALHMACQSLRTGESDLALAGGCTVMATPRLFVEFSRQRGLAADGRCKPFSDLADGTSWGEGAGMLVLERLSDAKRHGRAVLAVVRGSAVNQDGKSQGLTAPNGPAQEQVIRQALAAASLAPRDVDVVEAHGTGTTLGDPIEGQALIATYGTQRSLAEPLWLGCLKSNIGHTQAAAGVAGVIKMVLALQHQRLPKSLHAETPTRHVDWSADTVKLLCETQDWKPKQRPRRAGVSSFGISGTNAHVIVEEAPALERPAQAAERAASAFDAPHGFVPVLLSAKSPGALRAQAQRLRLQLQSNPALALLDVAHSLATTRTLFDTRAVAIVKSRDDLLGALDSIAAGEPAASVVSGRHSSASRLAFLFSGQGSQLPRMGYGLYVQYPVFQEALDAVFRAFEGVLDRPLRELMFAESGSTQAELLDQTQYTQPALFALEVALYRTLQAWGVRGEYLLGHSVGEIAAAHVAGVMSLTDACTLVAARGRLIQALPPGGGMLAIEASEDELRPLLQGYAGRLSLAALNGAHSSVVSGDDDALSALAAQFATESRKLRKLVVSHAFHSARIDPMLEEYERVVKSLELRPAQLTLVSSVTGEVVARESFSQPSYWVKQVREAVRFYPGVQALQSLGASGYLELGPQGVLAALTRQAITEQASLAVWPVLRKQRDDQQSLLLALAGLHTTGHTIDWSAFFAPLRGQRVQLPTYAFERTHYWSDVMSGREVEAAGMRAAQHPLLAASLDLPDGKGVLWTGQLSRNDPAWLAEHVVFGTTILPGTALLELALVAAHEVGLDTVVELSLEAPLVIPARGAVRVQLAVGVADATGLRTLTLHSRAEASAADGDWTRHASGLLGQSTSQSSEGLQQWPPAGAQPLDLTAHADTLCATGAEFGATFGGLNALYQRDHELFAEVALPEHAAADAPRYLLHPALLQAALRALAVGLLGSEVGLPVAWQGVRLYAHGASALRVRLTLQGTDSVALLLTDATGEPLGEIACLALKPASAAQVRGSSAALASLYELQWTNVLMPRFEATSWVLLGAGPGLQLGLPPSLPPGLPPASRVYPDMTHLRSALDAGEPVPSLVLVSCAHSEPEDVPRAARAATQHVLEILQAWLADERLAASRLVVLTQAAVAVGDDDNLSDLVHAPVWGLLRAAQAEHPQARWSVLDWDHASAAQACFTRALAVEAPQLALREGRLLSPTLARVAQRELLLPDATSEWSLQLASRGTLDGLALVAHETGALGAGDVRVSVRAAGLNFRDLANALGMWPGEPMPLGFEGAGVVVEVGSQVTELAPGDRVHGVLARAFGPTVITDQRYLTRIPSELSFVAAASVPVAFLTAYYALIELAQLQRGERVLIHAAAGGVGMAAVQLARNLGAEVFATASPEQWHALRELGLDDEHIAASRELMFEQQFMAATGGRGVDVVLASLAGECVDAALRLLRPGGRFVEMGKTDLRNAEAIAAERGGTLYRAFDLFEVGPDAIQRMLMAVSGLFERGVLRPLPCKVWDVRHAPEAFRAMEQARHIGKIVLTLPSGSGRGLAANRAHDTVLVTGGTGTLGALVAEHLVVRHGVRRLLLCSRTGQADALQARLEAHGAVVTVMRCDVSDRAALQALLNSIPAAHPLRAVFHTAGVVDDGVLEAQNVQRIERVFAPKVDAAWHLHELTARHDLDAFVMFSSVAGVLGSAGQSNYAAANAFLDALAQQRRAEGLVAHALDWGLWAESSGLTRNLSGSDRARLARAGIEALSSERALQLLDAALLRPEAQLTLAQFNLVDADRAQPMLRELVDKRARRRSVAAPPTAAPVASFKARLSALPAAERQRVTLELVSAIIATVLGELPSRIEAERPIKELGLDSLLAVELRNALSAASGLRLSSTLLFNYPTPLALAQMLQNELLPSEADIAAPLLAELERLEALIAHVELKDGMAARLAARLELFTQKLQVEPSHPLARGMSELIADDLALVSSADDEQLFRLVDQSIGK